MPEAKTAVDKEWTKLQKILAWDESKVTCQAEVIQIAKLEGKTVHFATFVDLCHLRSLNWRKSAKSTNKENVLRAEVVKDDSGNNAVFTQQGASATHMAAANVLDVTWRWPRCSGQASGAVSVYTQVKMQDAPELLHLSDKDCPTFWIRTPRARRPQHWDSIHDPVVPLERNLYDHPLAGLLWERKIEEVLFEHGQSNMGVSLPSSQVAIILVSVCRWDK